MSRSPISAALLDCGLAALIAAAPACGGGAGENMSAASETDSATAGRTVSFSQSAGDKGRPASDAYNQKLSERRAASVVDWLIAHGVKAKRLEAVGWGESRPVGDNGTPEGRQQNRRVDVVIEKV